MIMMLREASRNPAGVSLKASQIATDVHLALGLLVGRAHTRSEHVPFYWIPKGTSRSAVGRTMNIC